MILSLDEGLTADNAKGLDKSMDFDCAKSA